MPENDDASIQPSRHVVLAVGTYEGGIAAYEIDLSDREARQTDTNKANTLQMVFASPIHQGSVRSLSVASGPKNLLISTGYDEMMKIHDFSKHRTSCGEIRTPPHLGTPVCSAFAPPLRSPSASTHCLIGFSGSYANEEMTKSAEANGGKLVIYKKRDWSVQHVLNGHEGGIAAISVHPTGKLALTGGINDGKLKLWDLERGRLAYSSTVGGATKGSTISSAPASAGSRKNKLFDSIVSIVWSEDGSVYGFCYGSHITVRQVETGNDLLDVELPSKANQICLIQGPEGLFVAAACNDGSLPVLAVGNIDMTNDSSFERRAIMAIEPIDGPVAGVERFKCIQTITGYHVATANSAGVLSVMNLQGAVSMISSLTNTAGSNDDNEAVDSEDSVSSDDDDDDDKEFAVDIIDGVRIGSGARITCLVAWTSDNVNEASISSTPDLNHSVDDKRPLDSTIDPDNNPSSKKQKQFDSSNKKEIVELDSKALEKARLLVSQAKKIQKRKNDRRTKVPRK